MPERPDNYDQVLKDLEHGKQFSAVRLEAIKAALLDVLDGKKGDRFKDWTEKDVQDALKTVEK